MIRYSIPELVVPIRIFLQLTEEATEPRVSIDQVEVTTSEIYGHHLSWLILTEYLCHKWQRICSTCLNPFTVLFVTRVTRWVPLVDQELLNLLRHLSYPLAFSRIRVVQSLVFCVAFCWSLFALLSFCVWPLCCLSFDLRFVLPLWYLQTLLRNIIMNWKTSY